MSRADQSGVKLKERAVLKKFEGDSTDDKDLVEVIVAEDGVVTDRWQQGDDRDPPE